jgi:hypothetical protein
VLEKVIAKEAIPLEPVEREEALQVLRIALWKTSAKYDSRSPASGSASTPISSFTTTRSTTSGQNGGGMGNTGSSTHGDQLDSERRRRSTTALLELIDWEALPAATRQTIRTLGPLMQEGCSQSEMAKRLKLPEARVAAMRREMRDAIVDQAVRTCWTSSSRRTARPRRGAPHRVAFIDCGVRLAELPRAPNGMPGWQTPDVCGSCGAMLEEPNLDRELERRPATGTRRRRAMEVTAIDHASRNGPVPTCRVLRAGARCSSCSACDGGAAGEHPQKGHGKKRPRRFHPRPRRAAARSRSSPRSRTAERRERTTRDELQASRARYNEDVDVWQARPVRHRVPRPRSLTFCHPHPRPSRCVLVASARAWR